MKKFIYFLLFIIPLPAVYFLLRPGFFEPHDLHHFADIFEMYRAFGSGQFPPRLGPDFFFGFGYPLFNFYYLMPFYLGAFFYSILGSVQTSFKIIFILSAFLSVAGMYLFLKEFFSKIASIAGATLFLYTPYRAVQIYVRGAMGEVLALSLAPFVFWIFVKLIKNPKKKGFILLAPLITSAFIISHNYLWALFSPFLLFFSVLIYGKKDFRKSYPVVFLSAIASLGLTAFWWLPAIIEQKLVSSQTPFPLIDHFPFIKQLIIPSWGYGSSVWGPGDEISFQVGIINWLVFLTFFCFIIFGMIKKNSREFKISIWALCGFLISLFMMNIRSYPLWKILPFHDFIQFPWRLLILTTFFTAVMAGIIVDNIKNKKILSLIIVLGSIFLTFVYFRPSQIFFKSDSQYLSRFFASINNQGEYISQDYLNYSEDYLLLPKWVPQKINKFPLAKIESENVKVENIKEATAVNWQADVSSDGGGVIFFNSYYFPGWFSQVDGRITPIITEENSGRITINVNPGTHKVKFYWKETMLRRIADLISIFSLAVLGLFVVSYNNKNKKLSD